MYSPSHEQLGCQEGENFLHWSTVHIIQVIFMHYEPMIQCVNNKKLNCTNLIVRERQIACIYFYLIHSLNPRNVLRCEAIGNKRIGDETVTTRFWKLGANGHIKTKERSKILQIIYPTEHSHMTDFPHPEWMTHSLFFRESETDVPGFGTQIHFRVGIYFWRKRKREKEN